MVRPTDIGRVVKASDTITYQKVGPTMFEILWDKMDELVLEFYMGLNGEHPNWNDFRRSELQGEMRGVAFAIREWSSTWYQEPNAVAKHAKRRYDAYIAGEEMPPTVGCNGYNPLPVSKAPRGFKDISKPVVPPVSPETAAQIKNGLAIGFPVEDLMNIYKVTKEQVEACR